MRGYRPRAYTDWGWRRKLRYRWHRWWWEACQS